MRAAAVEKCGVACGVCAVLGSCGCQAGAARARSGGGGACSVAHKCMLGFLFYFSALATSCSSLSLCQSHVCPIFPSGEAEKEKCLKNREE